MRLLFFGTYDVRSHPRVRVLIEGLRERGEDVAELNVPLGLDTAARVEILRRPWLVPWLVVRLGAAWTRLLWRSRRYRRPDAVVVGYLGQFDVLLARLRWPGVPRVLDYLTPGEETARDRGVGGRVAIAVLGRLDRAALQASDVIAVDTTDHADMLPTDLSARGVCVPVGAPRSWFRAPTPGADGPLRVIFFGLYTPLQGAPVIGAAIAQLAATNPEIRFTMVGKGQELPVTQTIASGHPGVEWLDWVDAAELPGLVAAHDVCLGIFGTGEKAQRVVPNKVFQGAAAGCAIVTSDTKPQRLALEGAGVFVTPGDPNHLAVVLAELADDPEQTQSARREAYDRACEGFAPTAVVASLHERLHAAGP